MANWNARIASDFEYAAWENNIYKDKSSETESAEMNAIELSSSISRFVEQIKPTNDPSDDVVIKGLPKWFIEDLENSATMLRQQAREIEVLKQSYELLFKHRIKQEKLIASISKQSLVEDLNDMHIAKSIQRARDYFKFGEKK